MEHTASACPNLGAGPSSTGEPDMTRFAWTVLIAGVLLSRAAPSGATVHAGSAAPTFAKNQLDPTGTPHVGDTLSLGTYAHKVLVLNLLGYACPFCKGDGSSVEVDIWQHYESLYPGRVKVVGVDLWDGTPADLDGYRNITGTTYPLLLAGTGGAGGNLSTLYGTYDNFVVLNSQGIVRYHAADSWPHGNRYHLNEIRGCIDSLIANIVGVEGGAPRPASLSAGPSPFRGSAAVDFQAPPGSRDAEVSVHSAEGRLVRRLYSGAASSLIHVPWDGRDEAGVAVPAGVYIVRARAGSAQFHKKIVALR